MLISESSNDWLVLEKTFRMSSCILSYSGCDVCFLSTEIRFSLYFKNFYLSCASWCTNSPSVRSVRAHRKRKNISTRKEASDPRRRSLGLSSLAFRLFLLLFLSHTSKPDVSKVPVSSFLWMKITKSPTGLFILKFNLRGTLKNRAFLLIDSGQLKRRHSFGGTDGQVVSFG